LQVREGILLTVLVWLAVVLFGALPFLFTPAFPSWTDAVFESASGFTTTGATILPDVEVLPPAIQFWRHFAHWLGGMGVVLLGIAVLPLIGAGGMALYRAEFSGARSEKLKPRITETALSLWRIYVALTLAEYLLLRLAGLDAFEAACHAFSTLGTGGFSTRTASVAGFQSPAIEYIILVFMILAGMNFTQHYRLWRRGEVRVFLTDVEIRGFVLVLAVAGLVVMASLLYHHQMPLEPAFRAAMFQVASIGTTTGFATADYEQWAPLCHAILFGLMFMGGCTGSTAGGWKVSRVILMGRLVRRELRRTSERRGVFTVRLGDQVIPEQTIQSLLNLVYLSLLVFMVSTLLLSATGIDLLTSLTAVAAAMFSVGPGFGTVGPAENYAHLPALAKWVLTFCMIAGRLEFYTLIVVCTPAFWRK
jgi:trk system potassium uptake protein TrkH